MGRTSERNAVVDAKSEIARLLGDLESTLEVIGSIPADSSDVDTLRIIEDQQDELYRVIDEISHGMASAPPRFPRFRRALPSVAAGIILIAAGVFTVSSTIEGPDPTREASAAVQASHAIEDPTARIHALVGVYHSTRVMPDGGSVDVLLAEALDKAIEDGEAQGTDESTLNAARTARQDLIPAPDPDPEPATPSAPTSAEEVGSLLTPDDGDEDDDDGP